MTDGRNQNEDASAPASALWMLREIFDQPRSLRATLDRYVDGAGFREQTCAPALAWLREAREVVIAASGSSRHAAMVAELLMEDTSGMAVDVEYASEYAYRSDRATKRASVMVVSQSGETADTLLALRKANRAGCSTLALTNVAGSSMDREATAAFPTEAGRERAIPATKSFTAQLLNLFLLSLLAGEARGELDRTGVAAGLADVRRVPPLIEAQLERWNAATAELAARFEEVSSFLFLGRGVHYPIAREGALKLKESAYVHAEGYPSGELKHGPNALVSKATPLVVLAAHDPADPGSRERHDKTLHLLADLRAQGAEVLALANAGDDRVAAQAAHVVEIEPVPEGLLPLCEVIPLQMFAYHMAVRRGIDVDRPRNLTKAVLAE